MVNLQEVFSFLPRHTTIYCEVDGYTIKSSKDIEDTVLTLTNRHWNAKHIYKIIEYLLRNQILVVGYSEDGNHVFVNRVKSYMKKYNPLSSGIEYSAISMYHPSFDKIIILLDKNVKLTGEALYDIPNTILHNVCRYTCTQDRLKMINKVGGDYIFPYYETLIKNIVKYASMDDIEVDPSDVFDLTRRLVKHDSGTIRETMIKAGYFWRVLYDIYTTDYSNVSSISLMKYTASPYLKHTLGTLKPSFDYIADNITEVFYNTYREVFDKNFTFTTIPGTEFIYPSEIVATCAENEITPDVIHWINSTIEV